MTPADIRAMIAKSDGTDQGKLIELAFDALVRPLPHAVGNPLWLEAIEADIEHKLESRSYTDAALLIAEAVDPCWHVMSSESHCIISAAFHRINEGFEGTAKTRALAIIDAVCAAKAEATP